MNDIIGKTVQAVEVQTWAGRDTYKDDVTWERTVITFTDGSTLTHDSQDGDIYDEYRCSFDADGFPVPLFSEGMLGKAINDSRAGAQAGQA